MVDSATVGRRIAELRQRRGLTQAQLAGSRLSASYVSLIEAGRRMPSPAVVVYLAQVLGCSAAQLTGEEGPPGAPQVELLIRRAEMEGASGFPAIALDRFEEAAKLAAGLAAPALVNRARAGRAKSLEQLGRLGEAAAAWEQLIDASRLDAVNGLETTAIVGLCRCLREAGDLDRAIAVGEAYWSSTRSALSPPGSEDAIVIGATLLGAYLELQDMERCQALSAELMDLADESYTSRGSGAAYWNAALVAEAEGRVSEALWFAERARASFAETEDVRNRARLQVALGGLHLRSDPPDELEALRLLSAADPVLRQFGSAVDSAYCRTEIARAHLQLGALDEALSVSLAAMAMFDEAAPPLEIARTLMVAASACYARNDDAEALRHAHRAAALLESAGAVKQAASRWAELAEIYATIGDHSEAIDCFRRATTLLGVKRTAGVDRPEQARADTALGA